MTALEGRQVGFPSHDGRACRVPAGTTTAALLPYSLLVAVWGS